MQIGQYQGLPRITIEVGESYVTEKKEEIISTLLGSCIAACLYDPVNHIIGMNHFLLVQQHSTHNTNLLSSEAGRYGIHAMELLINKMLKHGAQRTHLKAKAFGGGDVLKLSNELHGGKSIGTVNCEFIKTFLNTEHIPLVSFDLGGNTGRNIFFLAKDFSVYLKRIEPTEELLSPNKNNIFLKDSSKHTPQPPDPVIYW